MFTRQIRKNKIQQLEYFILFTLCLICSLGISQNTQNLYHPKKSSTYVKKEIVYRNLRMVVPVGWKLYSEQEKNDLINTANKHSKYSINFNYYLTLDNDDNYPNITIAINTSENNKNQNLDEFFSNFTKSYDAKKVVVLDGAKSFITNQRNDEYLIDRKRNCFFIPASGTVANFGEVRSSTAVILKEEHKILIAFSSLEENFDKFVSALEIMINSIENVDL